LQRQIATIRAERDWLAAQLIAYSSRECPLSVVDETDEHDCPEPSGKCRGNADAACWLAAATKACRARLVAEGLLPAEEEAREIGEFARKHSRTVTLKLHHGGREKPTFDCDEEEAPNVQHDA